MSRILLVKTDIFSVLLPTENKREEYNHTPTRNQFQAKLLSVPLIGLLLGVCVCWHMDPEHLKNKNNRPCTCVKEVKEKNE